MSFQSNQDTSNPFDTGNRRGIPVNYAGFSLVFAAVVFLLLLTSSDTARTFIYNDQQMLDVRHIVIGVTGLLIAMHVVLSVTFWRRSVGNGLDSGVLQYLGASVVAMWLLFLSAQIAFKEIPEQILIAKSDSIGVPFNEAYIVVNKSYSYGVRGSVTYSLTLNNNAPGSMFTIKVSQDDYKKAAVDGAVAISGKRSVYGMQIDTMNFK